MLRAKWHQELIQKHVCPAGDLYLLDRLNFTNEILFASPRLINLPAVIKRCLFIESKLELPNVHSKRKHRRWLKEAAHAGLSQESLSLRAQRLQCLTNKL